MKILEHVSAFAAALGMWTVILVVFFSAHRHAGPSFVFGPPENITVAKDGGIAEREVKFPNYWPLQWDTAFSITPLFKAGDVIEIDLNLLGDQQVNDCLIRIDEDPLDTKGRDASASYFFKLRSKLPDNKKVVRLKIDYVVSEDTIGYRRRAGDCDEELFWLKEVYVATLID